MTSARATAVSLVAHAWRDTIGAARRPRDADRYRTLLPGLTVICP